jgi:hypothetical protein
LLIAKSQMERHNLPEAMLILKKAMESIAEYKQVGDAMYKQISTQEREARRIHAECTQRIKAVRKKEKQRARAMFGNFGEEKKDSDKKDPEAPETSEEIASDVAAVSSDEREIAMKFPVIENTHHDGNGEKPEPKALSKKRVTFADGSLPGDLEDDPSFFEEHKEALFILTGIAIGCIAMHFALRKRV